MIKTISEEKHAYQIDKRFLINETKLTLKFPKGIKRVTYFDGPRSRNPQEIEIFYDPERKKDSLEMRYNVIQKSENPDGDQVSTSTILLENHEIYRTTNIKKIIPLIINCHNIVVGRVYFE